MVMDKLLIVIELWKYIGIYICSYGLDNPSLNSNNDNEMALLLYQIDTI